jgi:hypothetical protein
VTKTNRVQIHLLVEPEDIASLVNSMNRMARCGLIGGYTISGIEQFQRQRPKKANGSEEEQVR